MWYDVICMIQWRHTFFPSYIPADFQVLGAKQLKNQQPRRPWIIFLWFVTWLDYPLVMTNIAIENGHRNSGISHEKWWFSIATLNYQRVFNKNDAFQRCLYTCPNPATVWSRQVAFWMQRPPSLEVIQKKRDRCLLWPYLGEPTSMGIPGS